MKIKTICLLMLAIITVSGFTEVSAAEKSPDLIIEKIDVNAPDISVIFKLIDKDGNNVQLSDSNDFKAMIGAQELSVKSCRKVSEDGGSIYYVLIDISTNVNQGELDIIKNELIEFTNDELEDNDKLIIYTYDSKIKQINISDDTKTDYISIIKKIKRGTSFSCLNIALDKVVSDMVSMPDNIRKSIIIYGTGINSCPEDTVDIPIERIKSDIVESKIPVHTIGFIRVDSNSNEKYAKLSTLTQGSSLMFNVQNMDDIKKLLKNLNSVYIVKGVLKNNIVSKTTENLKLIYTNNGDTISKDTKFLNDKWIIDDQAPKITEIVIIDDMSFNISYSEPVSNAQDHENYVLTNDKGVEIEIELITYDETDLHVSIVCDKDLHNDGYMLYIKNVIDISMEKNLVDDKPHEFSINNNPRLSNDSGVIPGSINGYNVLFIYIIIGLLMLLMILTIIIIARKKY